jgi:putative ABC transport system substrate-binding protein
MDRCSRRRFVQGVGVAGLGLVAGCGRWPGQAPPVAPKVPRVGWLIGTATPSSLSTATIVRALAAHGFVDGQTVSFEYRSSAEDPQRLPALAAALVELPVDLIIATGPPSVWAAREATGTIPIVMHYTTDPVADGVITSLARPGGNITGVTADSSQLQEKRLEFLKETVPGLWRVGRVNAAGSNLSPVATETLGSAAERLGLQVDTIEINAGGVETGLDALIADGVGALLVNGTPGAGQPVSRIAELASRKQLPSVYETRDGVLAGGLMAYGPNVAAQYRRVGDYAARVLAGASPADLPVEQPTSFDFVINLETAQALGLTIPERLLLQATEILQ